MVLLEVVRILEAYQSRLEKQGEICSYPLNESFPDKLDTLCHARSMIETLLKEIALGEISETKAHLRLGFIQCVLWVNGFYTIENMSAHNRGEI